MYQSDQINELAEALASAQGKLQSAKKDSMNPHFKSKYADLSSVWEACRSALSESGLSVVQTVQKHENSDYLVTTMMHKSGQWLKSYLPIAFAGDGRNANLQLQQLGSCLTYLRRYALAAMVGVVADEDDDGNSGQQTYISSSQSSNPVKKVEIAEEVVTQVELDELEKILVDDQEYRNAIIHSIKKPLNLLPRSMYQRALSKGIERKKAREGQNGS